MENIFIVERPSDWLVFKFQYERPHTWRSINLMDPEGRIRFSHLDCYNERTAVIHRNPVYSGYLTVPGSIQEGEWKIEFADKQSDAFSFSFEWEAGTGSLPSTVELTPGKLRFWTDTSFGDSHYELNLYDWDKCRNEAPGWYKGDFHTHTVLSDGKMTPEQNMEQAEKMGLDFFAATDHNLFPTSWPAGKALVIPGMEVTSDNGHWNALGLRKWIDWRESAADGGMGTEAGMNRLLEEAGQGGALRSINHPMLAPWAWIYQETPLDLLDAMEIVNDPTYHSNPEASEKALILWNELWNDGRRITGIGGSDSHLLPTESYREDGPPSVIGDPATFVYADRLSASALLAGVKAGRVYVSRGPVLDTQIGVDGRTYPPGSDLSEAVAASPDGRVHFALTVSGVSEGKLLVVENGQEVAAHEISEEVQSFQFHSEWKAAGYVWRRFEIRGGSGELLAFTNPVSCGTKQAQLMTWRQLLDKCSFTVPSNQPE